MRSFVEGKVQRPFRHGDGSNFLTQNIPVEWSTGSLLPCRTRFVVVVAWCVNGQAACQPGDIVAIDTVAVFHCRRNVTEPWVGQQAHIPTRVLNGPLLSIGGGGSSGDMLVNVSEVIVARVQKWKRRIVEHQMDVVVLPHISSTSARGCETRRTVTMQGQRLCGS